jgi:16S rRNA G527 N7-methylase RsmG
MGNGFPSLVLLVDEVGLGNGFPSLVLLVDEVGD